MESGKDTTALRFIGVCLSGLFGLMALANLVELFRTGEPDYAVYAVLFGFLAVGFGLLSASRSLRDRRSRTIASLTGVILVGLGLAAVVLLVIAIANSGY